MLCTLTLFLILFYFPFLVCYIAEFPKLFMPLHCSTSVYFHKLYISISFPKSFFKTGYDQPEKTTLLFCGVHKRDDSV